jgi:hypothetical protein
VVAVGHALGLLGKRKSCSVIVGFMVRIGLEFAIETDVLMSMNKVCGSGKVDGSRSV